MLKKVRAWLHAKLHLKCDYTIPGTDIHFLIIVHRITGRTHVDWSIPSYLLQAEQHRHAYPGSETQISVTTILPAGSDDSRRLRAPLN